MNQESIRRGIAGLERALTSDDARNPKTNKFLPLREELPPEPPARPTTTAMAESIVIGAFITGVNDAARHGYWRHLNENKTFRLEVDCKHEIVNRDITNRGTCMACGKDFGIGYAAYEYPPEGEYMGIARA